MLGIPLKIRRAPGGADPTGSLGHHLGHGLGHSSHLKQLFSDIRKKNLPFSYK